MKVHIIPIEKFDVKNVTVDDNKIKYNDNVLVLRTNEFTNYYLGKYGLSIFDEKLISVMKQIDKIVKKKYTSKKDYEYVSIVKEWNNEEGKKNICFHAFIKFLDDEIKNNKNIKLIMTIGKSIYINEEKKKIYVNINVNRCKMKEKEKSDKLDYYAFSDDEK